MARSIPYPLGRKNSLAAPYNYEITNTNQLPTPTQTGWKARLTTLAWEVKTYHTADYGYIFSRYADFTSNTIRR